MPSEEEEIINLIAQELMSGKSEGEVVNELVQAGLPQNEAVTVVRAISAEVQRRGGGGGAPRGPPQRGPPQGYAPPPKRHSYMTPIVLIIVVIILLYLALNG